MKFVDQNFTGPNRDANNNQIFGDRFHAHKLVQLIFQPISTSYERWTKIIYTEFLQERFRLSHTLFMMELFLWPKDLLSIVKLSSFAIFWLLSVE